MDRDLTLTELRLLEGLGFRFVQWDGGLADRGLQKSERKSQRRALVLRRRRRRGPFGSFHVFPSVVQVGL